MGALVVEIPYKTFFPQSVWHSQLLPMLVLPLLSEGGLVVKIHIDLFHKECCTVSSYPHQFLHCYQRVDGWWKSLIIPFPQCILHSELLSPLVLSLLSVGGLVVEILYKAFSTKHAAQWVVTHNIISSTVFSFQTHVNEVYIFLLTEKKIPTKHRCK